jgi:hypothetical protein
MHGSWMKREGIHFGFGAAAERSGPQKIVAKCDGWLVDELEKERRGQIVTGSRKHGLIAKGS